MHSFSAINSAQDLSTHELYICILSEMLCVKVLLYGYEIRTTGGGRLG